MKRAPLGPLAFAVAVSCSGDPKPVAPPRPIPEPPPPDAAPPPVPDAASEVSRVDDGGVLLEATPAIPAALREELQPYLEPRRRRLVSLAPNGRSIVIGVSTAGGTRYLEVDEPMGEPHEVAKPDPEKPSAAGASARASGEFRELYQDGTSLTGHIPWDVESTALSPWRRYQVIGVNAGGVSRLYVSDARRKPSQRKPAQPLAIKGLPDGAIRDLRFASKADVLGFTLSGATTLGDVYTYDLRRKKLVQWTAHPMGALDREALVTPERIEYSTFDGARVPALYYRPDGDGPHPVVIDLFRDSSDQARPRYAAFVQYLVTEVGFAVIQPNVRGSTGYGATWARLGDPPDDAVHDVVELADWITGRDELDAGRIGVIGEGRGAYLALAAHRQLPEHIRAAAAAGELDPVPPAEEWPGAPAGPIFVAQDGGVGRDLVKAAREAGHEAWYMLARGDAELQQPPARETYRLLSILFFQRNL